MTIHWGKLTAIALIALSMTACKGTDNTVTVTIDGYGEVSDGETVCTDRCTKDLPLTWLQSQLMHTKSVTYTPTPDFGYEFFGWTKNYFYTDACQDTELCTITVEARCGDLLDFRSSGIPCGDLESTHKSVTAVFLEQGSIAQEVWNNGRACVITTSDEIRCWGISPSLENNVPTVINPVELQMYGDVACVKDDAGLHCWGNEYYLGETQPALTDPEAFTINSGVICAIDVGQVACWGGNQDWVLPTPTLNNPTRITSVYQNVCVIDDDGVHCWGNQSDEPQFAPIESDTLVQLPNYDCTITEDTFECERFILGREEQKGLLELGSLTAKQVATCMRKLMTTLNAMVRDGKPWQYT